MKKKNLHINLMIKETRTESRVSVDDDDDETNIPSFLRKRGF